MEQSPKQYIEDNEAKERWLTEGGYIPDEDDTPQPTDYPLSTDPDKLQQ